MGVSPSRGHRAKRGQSLLPQPPSKPRAGWVPLAATVALALTCCLVVAAVPVPTGDLFVALAGGRDALAGRLGQPDDWSFATAGRVWMNQNWGSGVLFFLTHALAGEGGLVALKVTLTGALLAAMAALGRATGAAWPAAILAATVGLWAARLFPELRPNLLTLLFTPLFVLLLRSSPRRPWLLAGSVGLVTVWANTHGGFMLALLLLGLWAAARLLAAIHARGLHAAPRAVWPAAAACLAGVALAGLATPFSWTNLTFSLRLADPAWRTVVEWAPLRLVPHEVFGSPWEFIAVAVIALVATASRLVQALSRNAKEDEARVSVGWFDVGAAVAVSAMAVSAWRLVGVALVVLAPLAAPMLDRLLHPSRRSLPTLVTVAVLAVAGAPFASRVWRHFQPDNPRYRQESIFGRLVELDTFPRGAAEFLRANRVQGRAFNDWRWEGYLRWVAPQLRLFAGGRAQQVYDWATVARGQALPNHPTPAAELAALGADVVVVPMHLIYDPMVERLVFRAEARWLVVYYDGRDAVLVNAGAPAQRAVVEGAIAGRLSYPTPEIAVTSRALALAGPASGVASEARFAALSGAAQTSPTIGVYWALLALQQRGELDPLRLLTVLESEQARLALLPHRRAGGVELLKAKWAVAWHLSQLLEAVGRREEAARQAATAAQLRAELWLLLRW